MTEEKQLWLEVFKVVLDFEAATVDSAIAAANKAVDAFRDKFTPNQAGAVNLGMR